MKVSLLPEQSIQLKSSLSNSSGATTGIVFIDPKVDDYEMLMAGVTPGLEVVLLDENFDGIAQISQTLKGRRSLSSLHIVAHGEAGKLWLGKGFVDSSTLSQEGDKLQSWAGALAPDADILLYGCKVAAGKTGQQFVQLLNQLTGADVAASNNLTGSAALGGNWELEVKMGRVEAPIAFGAETVEAYNAVLTTRLVSIDSNGTQGNSGSDSPSLSADGRYVAFWSNASNLVSDDTNSTWDIFVYDTVANTTRRVSVDSNGTQGNGGSINPSISADGRYVAFYSLASNLVSDDTNNTSDIFVYDTVTNTTRIVSVANDGTEGNGSDPSISADGRYVAFYSLASNLVSGDTNDAYDIFVYDIVANTTRRVSVGDNGTQGNGSSYSPSISADGRYVAFYSLASNLVSEDTNDAVDIFVYDTVANTTRRVSVGDNGTQGNNSSYFPSISADGSYVAFASSSSNLVSDDTNDYGDIFVSNNPLASNISSPDFNGDGKADILWRNEATGQNVVWLMDGTNLTTVVDLTNLKYPNEPPNWSICGTGDFNSDGKEDILWRNSATGQNMMWLMDSTNLAIVTSLTPFANDVSWDISSTGDFNSDGKEDILWRNSATGQNVVWLMNGTNLTTAVELTPVADANWDISGTGDFNGDGQVDILWRNGVSGQNGVWLMNGTQLTTSVEIPRVADTSWSIGGTGDYNNDGQVDILWRNGTSGENGVWLMNGTQLTTSVALTPVGDSNWQIVA